MTEGNRKMVKIFSWLGALFMTLVIALTFKIYFALSTHQPVLDKNYYEKGLRYESYKAAMANSKDRRLNTDFMNIDRDPRDPDMKSLRQGSNQKEVLYQNTSGQPIAGAKISLELSRRATVNDNVYAHCETNAEGKCSLTIDLQHPGYWEGWLHATDPEGHYRLKGSFYANPQ